MRISKALSLLMVLAALVAASPATAYDLPSVNLGFTSFVDGAPPAGPGYYFQQYFQYYTSDELTDPDGDPALPSFAGEELDVFVSLSQFIYQSNTPLLAGGKWGMNVMVPVVSLDMSYDNNPGGFPEDNGSGLGDILVGPFLQWDPIMGENGPKFMQRVELQMLLPTGKYDADKALNPGSNYFSFNPYYSCTAFFTPQWTASARIHYLWNAKNTDPQWPGASDTQAGQAIHANLASAYEVMPKQLRVGLNAYYLQQITDTKADGDDVADTREMVFGIGPGVAAHFGPDDHLFFNAYFETKAKMRPKGERFNLRWVHHF